MLNVSNKELGIIPSVEGAYATDGPSDGGNTTLPPLAPYYDLSYRIVGCLFVSAIFVVGIVGNVMVVIVVSRTPSMHTPTNCYLVSLALADILVLISSPLPTIWEFFLIKGQFILGRAGCSIMVYSQYMGTNASVLSITAFTVERYIAICHPMRAQTMCTVHRAKRIIAGLWVFSVLYCSPWLALTTLEGVEYRDHPIVKCTYLLDRKDYVIIYMADLVMFYVIPVMLTCVLYALITRILFTTTITATQGKAISNGCVAKNGKASSKKPSGSSSRVQVLSITLLFDSHRKVLKLHESFLERCYRSPPPTVQPKYRCHFHFSF